ncbi:MAG: hypothetical protein DRQ63_04280 [Gammaproteobacteria bacterium]|nr:MAG: hypothetical protein DRQ63_04280 [Gammaproteobacteria bacterium]
MRWSRIGLYTLAGTVAVLLMAVLVLISVDLGMFKSRIELLVTDLLDRELRIDGELHAYVGTSIELYAEDVYLANPEWADEEAFVTVGKIDVAIDAWSLVKGPIEIERVDVNGVRVNLETNDAGDASWIFTGLAKEPDSDVDEVASRSRLPIILDYAAISDAQVSYTSPAITEPLRFISDSLQSSFAADVFKLELTGSLNGTPLHFVKTTSPVENLLAYENVTVELSGNIGEITVHSSARIDDLLAPRRPRLEMSIEGPGAAYLTDILSIEPITEGPLKLSVSVKESGEQMIASLTGVFGEFDFSVDGQFQDIQELHNIDLNFAADGPDIGTIIRLAGREYAESDPFEINGRISRAGSEITIDNVLVAIGASNLTINGLFGEFPTIKGGQLSLAASGPDYGRFNRLFGMPGRLGGSFTTSLKMTPNGDGRERVEFAVNTADISARMDSVVISENRFTGTTMQFEISGPDISTIASAAGVDGLPREDFRITANVEKDPNGYLVRNLEAVVDDDVFKIAGHIGDKPFAGETNLEVDFFGSDLGASVIAFGGTAENLPKGGYYLKGRVQKEDEKLWLRDISAAIGDDEEYQFQLSGFITGDAQFVGSQVKVQAHGESLAALGELARQQGFPDLSFDVSADIRRGSSNTYFENGIFTSGRAVVEFAGAVGDQPLEDDMALTFNASFASMKDALAKFGINVEMLPEGELIAAGAVRQEDGQMSVEQFDATFGGATLQISGDIGQLPSLTGTKLRFDLDGDNLSRLLPANISRESLAQAFSASGRVSLSGNDLELERFRASVGHTSVGGDFVFGLDPFFDSGNFDIKADSPDIFQLLPKLRDVAVPQVAKLKYRGSGSWADNFWSFDNSRLELGDGYLEISGSLDGPPNFERTDLEFEWVASSVSKLSAIAGRELPDHPLLLKARLVGTRDVMTMEHFELTFGESDLHGEFTMRAGAVPSVKLNVTSGLFDISEYMPEPEEEPQPATTVVDGRVIPDAPLRLELLQSFDADVDIRIDKLRTRSFRSLGFDLDALVSVGALHIQDLSLNGPRGGLLTFSGNLTPNESGGADFALTADGKNLVLGLRSKNAEELQRLPLFEVRADLAANGETVRDLAGSIDGYIRVAGGAGRIPSGSLAFLAQDFLTELISSINPFTKSDPYTNVECAVILLHFYDGEIEADPVFVQQTDKLRIFANTKIDLKTEKLDANFRTVPRKGLGLSLSNLVNPYIKVTGTLGKPAVVINPEGVLIEGGVAVATAGLSILAKSFKDRFLSDKDPCGTALADADKKFADRKSQE